MRELQTYVERLLERLHTAKSNAVQDMLGGSLSSYDEYKFVTGQFAALDDLEVVIKSEYTKLAHELYGAEGDSENAQDESNSG